MRLTASQAGLYVVLMISTLSCVVLAFGGGGPDAIGKGKYSAEANSPFLGKIDVHEEPSLKKNDEGKLYRIQKLNLFWSTSQQYLRGEQKLKKLKNELKILDKEVLKKKQLDGTEDFRKMVEVRLHDLVEKFALPAGHFSAVFEYDKDREFHKNSVIDAKENNISDSMFEEEAVNSIWEKALKTSRLTTDEMDQLKNELERLEHRLAKKRHLERQHDEDKKNEDVKRRLKDITYKADKQRKEIESRFFLDHSEL